MERGVLRAFVACLALLLLLPGCGARPVAQAEALPRLVLVLLDLSGSTEAVRTRYGELAGKIIESVPAGARLVLLPVSANSLTTPAALDITFPAYSAWRTNALTHRREMNRLRKEAMEAVSGLGASTSGAKGTALIDSLVQAQEFLKGYPPGSSRIFLVSDMVEQQRDGLDFWGLTEADVEPALARIQTEGRVPNLHDAAVTVTGLEASAHLPAKNVRAIRAFWERLFAEAGARLIHYSPTLQL